MSRIEKRVALPRDQESEFVFSKLCDVDRLIVSMWPFTASYPTSRVEDVSGKVYDYIIVGGGTVGCVVASRLSEDPSVSVLVIERGAVNDTWSSRVPLISMDFVSKPGPAVVDRFSLGLPERGGYKLKLVTADAIGGSSRINGTLVTRGVPAGYNDWAERFGLTEWSWEKVEPYFQGLENAISSADDPSRGHTGRFASRRVPEVYKWPSYLEKPCRNLGLETSVDSNSATAPAQGYFIHELSIDSKGKRISAFSAFMDKATVIQRKDRLTVCTGAIVVKLKMNKGRDTAEGVYFQNLIEHGGGSDYLVTARREVILCSGALSTPQLLLLSGIGPKEELDKYGIPQVKELPVGKHLQDHIYFPIMIEVAWTESVLAMTKILLGLWNALLYILCGSGIMGNTINPRSVYVQTALLGDDCTVKASDKKRDIMDATDPHNIPDLEVMMVACSSIDRWLPGHSLISFLTTLVQPASKGTLGLESTNAREYPRISYPYFTEAEDIIAARKAARFSMRLATEFTQNREYPLPASLFMAPTINKEPKPSTNSSPKTEQLLDAATQTVVPRTKLEKTWETVSDTEIDEYVKALSSTALHFSSTCRMSLDPKDGVVDQSLRVHGFKNLRVADTSAFPKLPSAHTMFPAMMLGARCAEFIKTDWRQKQ